MPGFGPLGKNLPGQVPGVAENFGSAPLQPGPIQTAAGLQQVPVVNAGPSGYGGAMPTPGMKRD